MADEVAGLVAAAAIAQVQGDTASQRLFLATADNFRRLILTTTVTDNGPLSSQPYFIRIGKTGNPDQAFSYTLGNGDPTSYDQRAVVDQGFLELVRLGELPASSPLVTNSLEVDRRRDRRADPVRDRDHALQRRRLRRLRAVGLRGLLGQRRAVGHQRRGHRAPVAGAVRRERRVPGAGRRLLGGSTADLDFMLNSASGVGLVPEQVWNYPDVPASPYGSDPSTASIGFTDGQADGSAAPLTWAQAQLLRLIADQAAGRLLEQPSIVAARYESSGAPAAAPLKRDRAADGVRRERAGEPDPAQRRS